MSDPKNTTIVKTATDWPGVAFIIAVFALIVLCAGSPDLLDAITARVAGGQLEVSR